MIRTIARAPPVGKNAIGPARAFEHEAGHTPGFLVREVPRLTSAAGTVLEVAGRWPAYRHRQARAHVHRLTGIGPFSSATIVGRGLGHTDVRFGPITELNERVSVLYQLGHDVSPQELANIAHAWSPWRARVQVHFRAVTDRLPPRHPRLGNTS